MNIPCSLHRVAFAALAIGLASAPATFANATATTDTTAPAAPAGPAGSLKHQHLQGILTDAERAQLKSAKQQALAANPDLKAQKHNLKKQHKALAANKTAATRDQCKALHQQAQAYHQQLRAAELKIDPSLAPIFTKIDAAKHGHHHHST